LRIGIMCLASYGGSARIATELAAKLAQRGHRVHLFTRTNPFDNGSCAHGITLHTVTPDREANIHPASLYLDWSAEEFQTFLSRILDVITTEGLDILHFHYAVPFAFLAAEVKRYLGNFAPVLVGTLHGTDVSTHGLDPINGPRLTKILPNMDALTTVSNSHAQLATRLFSLSKPPKIIPNFVDLHKFQPAKNLFPKKTNGSKTANRNGLHIVKPRLRVDSPNLDPALLLQSSHIRPRIAHVSNFRPVKNTRSVAQVFLGIREQMDAELWLIGDGPEMDAVKSIVQLAGLEDDVRCWGLQQNVGPILAQTDLLLMTSLSESFCLAALEAMACGVPVLSTNVGGVSEVVTHGKTGFLFSVGDYDSAVDMAVRLLSNPAQHQIMRQTAFKHALAFGHNQIVSLYENLYRRLLYQRVYQPEYFIASKI